MSETTKEDSQIEQPHIISTINDDGSADFTVSFAEDDHRFSVSSEGDIGWIEYEESLTYRMKIHVSKPDEFVWRMLMQSDEMTQYLEENNLNAVRRKRKQ